MTIRQMSRAYGTRDNKIAWLNLVLTLAVYLGALSGAILTVPTWWLAAPLTWLAAVAAIRLFMLQHDCGHGSFFTSRRMNDNIGTLLSPFTLTPYKAARYNHNLHHAHIGNLEERDSSEIYTMTLAEYRAAPLWRRLAYRLYRSPLTLFVFGPSLLYVLRYRLPKNWRKSGPGNLLLHNALLAGFLALIWMGFGSSGLLIWFAAVVMGASMGALIPYVQHNFEEVFWARPGEGHAFETAALEGSAVLDLGWLFDLATANIAYHDLHHLNANIPSYNLKRCHDDLAEHLQSQRIGWIEAAGSFRWKLWDEDAGRMVGFPRAPRPIMAAHVPGE